MRDVGDAVRILHEVVQDLEDLSRSDLETLNSTLSHAQDHVASELNIRARRRNRGIDPEQAD